MKKQYNEIESTINTLETLVSKENNLRAFSIYTETDNAQYTLIAQSECKKETEVNRLTFQVLDETTKRNATVYIYFRATETCFECSDTFLKDYSFTDYEKAKRFKKDRTNVLTTDFEKTLFNLLAHHNIKLEKKATEKKATEKKATTKKATEKKAQKKVVNK